MYVPDWLYVCDAGKEWSSEYPSPQFQLILVIDVSDVPDVVTPLIVTINPLIWGVNKLRFGGAEGEVMVSVDVASEDHNPLLS